MPDARQTVVKMRISGTGIALNGMRAIKERRSLQDAKDAISCLHDALLAVARGKITCDEVRDFFWHRDVDDAKYFDTVVTFEEKDASGA